MDLLKTCHKLCHNHGFEGPKVPCDIHISLFMFVTFMVRVHDFHQVSVKVGVVEFGLNLARVGDG